MPTLILSDDARKFIEKLPPKHVKQVLLKTIALSSDPEPPDSIGLKDCRKGYRRTTSGEYLIIYRVVDDILEVFLIGKRNDDEVYRQLSRK